MDLGQLIRQHVTVVVVRAHAEAALAPLHQFHGRNVGEEVLQFAAAVGGADTSEETFGSKILLVMFVEHFAANLPEVFLPFENRFFRDDVGRCVALQASLKKVVRHLGHVIVGIVIKNGGIKIVCQLSLIHHNALAIDTLGWNKKHHAHRESERYVAIL